MTEQENRLYAVNLMNRAGIVFDAPAIGTVAAVLELVEGDVAYHLAAVLRGKVSRAAIVAAVTGGAYRPQPSEDDLPPIPPPPAMRDIRDGEVSKQ